MPASQQHRDDALRPTDDTTPTDPRRRLDRLFDPGSARSLAGTEHGRGAVAVQGTVRGNRAVAFATDPGLRGGSLAVADCDVVIAAHAFALEHGLPIVGVWHSGGAGLAEGARTMDRVARMLHSIATASGRILQVSLVLGPSAGAAAYASTLADVVVMAPSGRVVVTGPDVVRTLTGEEVELEDLGGLTTHAEHSGVVHLAVPDEETGFARVADLIELIAAPGTVAATVEDRPLPDPAERDVHGVVAGLLDADGWWEIQAAWARQLVVGLGRLGGRTVGVVANNPLHAGGWLDADSADKAARFVRMCDALGVPLLVLVDVPGILPGLREERGGALRRGAKLFHAFANASVPRINLVIGRAYGGAYIAMNAKGLGATRVLAWPDADLAVMPPDAAVRVLYRRRLAELPPERRAAGEADLIREHARELGGVAAALEVGAVDEVVDPERTRSRLAAVLRSVDDGRRGTHTNIPL